MKSVDYVKKSAFYSRCAFVAKKNNAPTEKITALENVAKKWKIMAEEAYYMEHRFDKAKKEKIFTK